MLSVRSVGSALLLLLTVAAARQAQAQPAKPATLPTLQPCVKEQGVPEKGIVNPGPPNPFSARQLTGTAAFGQLDHGAYRGTMSGMRVRLCEASLLMDRKDWEGARIRLDDAKIYSDALVLADQAFQVRVRTQTGLCLDYAKAASIMMGTMETQSAELKAAFDTLAAGLARFNKERADWQAAIDESRVKIRRAIDDHNRRESDFWHQVGSLFGVSSDDGIGEQLRTLDGIMQADRDRLYQASLRASLTEGAALQKYQALQTALAHIDQVHAQIGTLKKSINTLDDAKFGMDKLRLAFDAFVKEMSAQAPSDEFRWRRLKTKIEALRDTLFDYGESFPSGVLASCSPAAITQNTKQVPW
jgi:hypothetical protein